MISLYDVLEDKYSKRIAYMRISVDLTVEQVNALQDLAKSKDLSCSELVIIAIDDYLQIHSTKSNTEQAFSILAGKPIDGLQLQN